MFPLDISYLRPNLGDDNRLYWRYGSAYQRKVLSYSPIGFWPLDEASGSVAKDLSGNGFHGTYVGVTLGQEGIGDGDTCPLFDGANDCVDIYSAEFNTAFNPALGSAAIWAKVYDATVWEDAAFRYACNLLADGDNRIYIRREADNDRLSWKYEANNTEQNRIKDSVTEIGWMHLAITWSKAGDAVKVYYNGSQEGATLTGLDTWAGALASNGAVIGARYTTPSSIWHGWLGRYAVFDSVLSGTDILDLATV